MTNLAEASLVRVTRGIVFSAKQTAWDILRTENPGEKSDQLKSSGWYPDDILTNAGTVLSPSYDEGPARPHPGYGRSHDQNGQHQEISEKKPPKTCTIWRLVCQNRFEKLSSTPPGWIFHHFQCWAVLSCSAEAINLGCLLQKPINYQKLDKSEENYSKHSGWP